MFNPYTIILSLFIAGGLIATIWGWIIISRARETLQWPSVQGVIEESRISSDSDDLLPHIEFSYSVHSKSYRSTMKFPGDVTPTREFAARYVDNYPAGAKVTVYYHPDTPERATLEPGLAKGDWLVFAIGLITLLFGIVFLFIA